MEDLNRWREECGSSTEEDDEQEEDGGDGSSSEGELDLDQLRELNRALTQMAAEERAAREAS